MLRELGLKMQLGHPGCRCTNPGTIKQRFVICDVNGFHEVDIQYCGCVQGDNGITTDWQQLLRARLYPATTARPTTAFTFRLLDLFQQLTLQAKANIYDLHKTMGRITDNSGTVSGWVSHVQ